jgi:anti-sigma factor RsiW
MSRSDEKRLRAERPADADRILWRRAGALDVPADEAARWLDLAAMAEDRLDEDERARIEALLAADPDAAEDVAAARRLAADAADAPAASERVVARALALVPDGGNVIAFRWPARRRLLPDLARWSSLAAAVALAGWLGFAMGSDASLHYTQLTQPSPESAFPDLLDPSSGFLLRDLGDGAQT